MTDIELYFLKFNSLKQERLVSIRTVIKEEFPNSTERIYYGIPTVENNGEIILHYAAYKNHISIITGYDLTDFLKEKYPKYRYTRASVVFPDKEAFPIDFVKEICKTLK